MGHHTMTSNTLSNATTMFVDLADHLDGDGPSSLFDLSYTYSNDKYSCVELFYYLHVAFNYIVFVSGLVCLLTRIGPGQYMYLHAWSGRVYILAMLWSTATSLLIHNDGLPLAVLVGFLAVGIGLSFGWLVIIVYKQNVEREATIVVNERIRNSSRNKEDKNDDIDDIDVMLREAKSKVLASKTFGQRLFSLKSLHGILFFVSWMQIAGRIGVTKLSNDFTCHTYPVYKPDYYNARSATEDEDTFTLVSARDVNYDRLPWSDGPVQWSVNIIVGSAAAAIVVGALFTYYYARKDASAAAATNDEASVPTVNNNENDSKSRDEESEEAAEEEQ